MNTVPFRSSGTNLFNNKIKKTTMKKLMNYAAIAVTMIALLGASTLHAQEWTKEQKAVWQTVDHTWATWKAGDIDATFTAFCDDYLGWGDDLPLPMAKDKYYKFWKEMIGNISNMYYDIEPARILVHGNSAVVYYYYMYSYLYTDGDKSQNMDGEGKNIDFYVKENGKWMLLGDFGYSTSDKED